MGAFLLITENNSRKMKFFFLVLLNVIKKVYFCQVNNNEKHRIMKTVIEAKGFKVEFNGSKTWFVTDSNGDAWFATNSEKKAINKFNKIISCYA